MTFQNEFYIAENENLKRQLEQLIDAKQKEIRDLQDVFEEKLRKLRENLKNENIDPLINENKILKAKVEELTDHCCKLEVDKNELIKSIKQTQTTEKALYAELNHEREMQKQNVHDFSEFIQPFEDQIKELSELLKQKQEEINNLHSIINDECQERNRLQSLILSKK
ncbi:hypothetical protein TVAG_124550 [Trichomonas vaginalis G3]|uniref:Uncharacterized protein n=1 Tax=Trichomonas vaginalis (strain ATCC PRA-98 / G3) TaxID=412133 RepID=A2FYN3_TRIV3|nr:hypothetical protein TVAG_124550 [Trichomonas vaginalis G3]|eukprot:XP_001302914.1 hypothetical protein [Trichomonas vaginalis G3]